MPFAFYDECAAMRADIRHAAERGILVRRDHQRLVEAAFEKREREDMTRSFNTGGVGGELPASCEDTILLNLEVAGIRVDRTGQGGRDANVFVDLDSGQGGLAHQ